MKHLLASQGILRPNKSVFQVTDLKILGRVGTHFFLIFFFQEKNIILCILKSISIVVAIDETQHSKCLHFSTQKIEQSHDLTCAYRRTNIRVSQ